jgi:hypothetical protein
MQRISELDVGDGTYTEGQHELLLRAVDNIANSKFQPKLENWILVNFCEIYSRSRSERFEWVERGRPPAPDFRIFTQMVKDRSANILVAIVHLEPNRLGALGLQRHPEEHGRRSAALSGLPRLCWRSLDSNFEVARLL